MFNACSTRCSVMTCLRLQLSTRVLQSGQHEDLERVMSDKQRQQQVELEAAEAELDAEQAEQVKHVTSAANDDMTKAVKDGQRDLLMQVGRGCGRRVVILAGGS